ncbi:6-bladed beta-propeller [Rikenella microfusus]|uniref:6-bladed beta-propeller n=1 Tax=Rikenella microfusus TaxID=28139 RepID=A0A379MST4_9BACT|nr:6-bladed beta-propeller [Rikenella microfusus]SUE34593.1 Uncharacterised protein [Rikenella microfusus]
MRFRIVYLSCCALLVFSCQTQQQPAPAPLLTTIQWDDDSVDRLANIIAQPEIIPLENSRDAAFSGINQIRYHKGHYYIFDKYGANSLLVFDSIGNFIRRIGRKGHGPGEFIQLNAFTIQRDTIFALDANGQKILAYSTEGVYLNDRKTAGLDYPDDLAWLSDGFLFYRALYSDEQPDQVYAVSATNRDMEPLQTDFKYTEQSPRVCFELSFFESDSSIVFSRYLNDTLIVFDRQGGIRETLFWDFGTAAIPRPLRSEVKAVLERSKDFTYLASAAVPAGPFLTGTVSDHGQRGVFLYDSRDKRIYADLTGETIPALPSNLAAKDSTAIVSWLSYGVKDNFIPSLGKERVAELLPALENGQIFLVVYPLKKNVL